MSSLMMLDTVDLVKYTLESMVLIVHVYLDALAFQTWRQDVVLVDWTQHSTKIYLLLAERCLAPKRWMILGENHLRMILTGCLLERIQLSYTSFVSSVVRLSWCLRWFIDATQYDLLSFRADCGGHWRLDLPLFESETEVFQL